MKSIKSYFIRIVNFFVIILIVLSCTITTSKPKIIDFNFGLSTVDSSLKTLINYQSATINGFEKNTNGVITNEIEIKIINGLNLQKEDLKNLAKKVGSLVKNEVKNKNEFINYRVFFIKSSNGSVVKVNKWESWVFKSEEL